LHHLNRGQDRLGYPFFGSTNYKNSYYGVPGEQVKKVHEHAPVYPVYQINFKGKTAYKEQFPKLKHLNLGDMTEYEQELMTDLKLRNYLSTMGGAKSSSYPVKKKEEVFNYL
jgi:hypothetical protein